MLCKRFEAGGCNLGEKCQFAHGTFNSFPNRIPS